MSLASFKSIISRHVPSIFAASLILILILFMLLMLLFQYEEQQAAEERVAEITKVYNQENESLSDSFLSGEPERDPRKYLAHFKAQHVYEKLYERTNRRYTTVSYSAEFVVILIILFLSVWAEKKSALESDSIASYNGAFLKLLPFFAALAIAIPALNQKLGFDARQQLHDYRAQQLGFLVFELENGALSLDNAWSRYKQLYRQSPSSVAEYPLEE